MEILNCIFAFFITIFMGWFAWTSTIYVHEQKKHRYKNYFPEDDEDKEEWYIKEQWFDEDKNNRAKKKGCLIKCPFCEGETKVYHFNWVALVCGKLSCKRIVKKDLWKVKRIIKWK